jgi:hypothetical protein
MQPSQNLPKNLARHAGAAVEAMSLDDLAQRLLSPLPATVFANNTHNGIHCAYLVEADHEVYRTTSLHPLRVFLRRASVANPAIRLLGPKELA